MSSEWKIVTLSDISTSIGDGLHGTPVYDDSGEYFFINGNNLCDGEIVINDKTKRASRAEYEKHRKNIGDRTILVSINGTIGNIAFYNGENVFLGKSACYINLNETVDKYFVRYVLASRFFQDYISNLATGSTIKNVSLKLMRDFPFRLPPYEIQVSSASSLRALDDKLKLNRQINQTLEQMAQAIFQSWFVDFEPVKAKIAAREDWLARQAAQSDAHDDAPQFSSPVCYAHEFADAAAPAPATQADLETFMNRAAMCAISGAVQGCTNVAGGRMPGATKNDADLDAMPAADYQRLYHTASLFPDELVESELGEIPKGWAVVKIDDRYDVVMGQSPSGDSYNEEGEGVLFYQGRAEFGWRFPTPRLYTMEPKRMANKGDILMSVRAPVGDMNISLDDCCIGRGLCAIRHKSGCTSFSYYSLLSVKNVLERFNGEGTVFGSINQKDLKALSIVEPGCDLISEFSNSISVIDDFIEEKSAEILSLTHLRDSLLPKLLSGELDISALTELADNAAELGAAHV